MVCCCVFAAVHKNKFTENSQMSAKVTWKLTATEKHRTFTPTPRLPSSIYAHQTLAEPHTNPIIEDLDFLYLPLERGMERNVLFLPRWGKWIDSWKSPRRNRATWRWERKLNTSGIFPIKKHSYKYLLSIILKVFRERQIKMYLYDYLFCCQLKNTRQTLSRLFSPPKC